MVRLWGVRIPPYSQEKKKEMENFIKNKFLEWLEPFLRLIATELKKYRWIDYVTGYTTIETLSNINGVQKIKYTYSFGTAYRLIDTVNDTDAIYSNEACTSLITNKKI